MSSSFCQEDPSEATGVSLTSTTWTKQFVLLDEEQEGQPGEKEKPETNNPNYLQKALDGRFSCIVRLAVLMHLLRGDVRAYSACSEFKPSRLQRA
ncbi:unnamed protein product [Pleuronectes platessa]|uniref:Uncharacterized protein n=1 Tax=Pleuronectes platessa TaxID=8262 RepID=A0A9N7VIB4_PLEPL|nr:unnamed protein product [Pleuronectes platessa]CAB1455168.1 unnamed protein product [Pleuronectes platessa]